MDRLDLSGVEIGWESMSHLLVVCNRPSPISIFTETKQVLVCALTFSMNCACSILTETASHVNAGRHAQLQGDYCPASWDGSR